MRREEQRLCKDLKKTRYHWLKNDESLKDGRMGRRDEFAGLYRTIGKAFSLKSHFKDFWEFKHVDQAESFGSQWCWEAHKSDLLLLQKAVQTIRNLWQGILNHFILGLNNGILEGINIKI